MLDPSNDIKILSVQTSFSHSATLGGPAKARQTLISPAIIAIECLTCAYVPEVSSWDTFISTVHKAVLLVEGSIQFPINQIGRPAVWILTLCRLLLRYIRGVQ
jgi:hypothetical protein